MSRTEHTRTGYAFDVPNFVLISHLDDLDLIDTNPLCLLRDPRISEALRPDLPVSDKCSGVHELALPVLDDLRIDPTPSSDEEQDLSISEVALPAIEHIDNDIILEDDNVWEAAKSLPALSTEPVLLSWEAFANPCAQIVPVSSCLGRTGPEAFDAAIARAARTLPNGFRAGRPLQPTVLLRALCQLGLGRESTFFTWDEGQRIFQQVIPDGRVSGCSLVSSQSFFKPLLACGNAVRMLQTWVEKTRSAPNDLPAKHAIAGIVGTLLSSVEERIADAQTALRSLSQLQLIYEPMKTILSLGVELIKSIEGVTTDDRMLDQILNCLQRSDEVSQTVDVCRQMLRRTMWHWLRKVEGWTGIGTAHTSFLVHLKTSKHTETGDVTHADETVVPDFVGPEDQRLISSAGRCLRYLNEFHGDHALIQAIAKSPETQRLDLQFDFEQIDLLQKKADQYQDDLLAALAQYPTTKEPKDAREPGTRGSMKGVTVDAFIIDLDVWDLKFETGQATRDLPSNTETEVPDELQEAIRIFLQSAQSGVHDSNSTFEQSQQRLTPPLSLVPSLSVHSLLKTQHDLLSYTALHCILHEHSLVSHLDLHHAFSLFGSGLFVARLRTVLFSPDTETTERQSGVRRTGGSSRDAMGLHLGAGDRQQWPPASSEVRLALMNVLPDIWYEEVSRPSFAPFHDINTRTSIIHNRNTPTRTTTAVQSLSFTIRTDLDGPTTAKILDPNSIHALDFLALTYTPPPPLHPLFPPHVLAHYDRIFALQLRLLRVSAAVAGIHAHVRSVSHAQTNSTARHKQTQSAVRLSHVINTFHSTILSHVRYVAIDGPWASFLARLKTAADACQNPYPPATTSSPSSSRRREQQPSLDALAALHGTMLLRMLEGLLLRKKQGRVMEALEGVWESILIVERSLATLADVTGATDTGDERDLDRTTDLDLRALWREFRERKVAFVKGCDGLVKASNSGGMRHEGKDEDGAGDGLADLVALLMLDEHGDDDDDNASDDE